VKYHNPTTYHSHVVVKVKAFNKYVKHQGQGHKVKSVGIYEKVL
jgi:hypothetical protein